MEASHRAYADLNTTVTDTALRECIRKRMTNRKIICGKAETAVKRGCDGNPDLYGRTKYGVLSRSKDIHICVQNLINRYEKGEAVIKRMSETIIHEFAHSCGWEH